MSELNDISRIFKNGDTGAFIAVSLGEALNKLVDIGKRLKKNSPSGKWEAPLEQVLERKAIPIISGLLKALKSENIEALQGIDGLERKIWKTYWEVINNPACPSDFSIFILLGELINDPPLAPVTA